MENGMGDQGRRAAEQGRWAGDASRLAGAQVRRYKPPRTCSPWRVEPLQQVLEFTMTVLGVQCRAEKYNTVLPTLSSVPSVPSIQALWPSVAASVVVRSYLSG